MLARQSKEAGFVVEAVAFDAQIREIGERQPDVIGIQATAAFVDDQRVQQLVAP